jgi:hypothetical protein
MLDEIVTCDGCGSRLPTGFCSIETAIQGAGRHKASAVPVKQSPSSRAPSLDELLQEVAKVAYFRVQD